MIYKRIFQKFHRLKITGYLNEETTKLINTPRCGISDTFLDKTKVSEFKIGLLNLNNLKKSISEGGALYKRDKTALNQYH